MTDISVAVDTDTRPDSHSQKVHSLDDGRCDGSRTAPDIQYEIMRRHRNGLCTADISREVHCDPRTVKAVIQNWGTAQHTLRLEAHRSQVVENVILGMSEAAKRGKLDSLLSLSDRLGITEAPKGQQTSVGVQVILHGGQAPSELSLAKLPETSEAGENQAQIEQGLISQLMNTVEVLPQQALSVTGVPTISQELPSGAPVQAAQTVPATNVAEVKE